MKLKRSKQSRFGLMVMAFLAMMPMAMGHEADRAAEDAKKPSTIAEKMAEHQKCEGLLTFYTDTKNGKIWLQLPAVQGMRGEIGKFLYVESLRHGLGSNSVGLDRGQLGPTRVVNIRRVGGRVIIEQVNLRYRAISDNADERNAVRQSFATSILWAGKIETEDPDGRMLVDFTSFIVGDAHHVVATLKRSGQGSYQLDKKRSIVDPLNCRAFPENIEFEALLTFEGSKPGSHVRSTTPTPQAITLVQHHSFVKLPDDGYQPRAHDPRIACIKTQFRDYATPLSEPLEKRWINRHRLVKVDPTAARSRVTKPIVFYVDRGAPEPVRSALIEGGNWWAKAFDEAGFIDAFRVELMPEGAHPLDVRYNVLQWVHRSTRGWSYGGGVTDPRTGEIIKGHVTLGSLRIRQDILLFEGLVGAKKTGTGDVDDPIELALARIRQLSAHEIGHAIGFSHNFAASTYAARASVMDYPAPLISIRDGQLDFSDAYGTDIGAWDIHTVRYAYSQFPQGASEAARLNQIVKEGLQQGYRFMSDADARPLGSAHPQAHLWDNGDDPIKELEHSMKVRRIAMDRFGAGNIAPGRPLALLHETLLPLYLHHRYQLGAATKIIGGLHYEYALRGDGQDTARPIDPATQRRALQAVLACIDPAELDLSEAILELLQPRPFGYSGNREMFGSTTSPLFDSVGAASTAAQMALRGLLNPQRCARLVDFHRRAGAMPSLEEVLGTIVSAAFDRRDNPQPRWEEIQRAIQNVVVVEVIGLAMNGTAPFSVRSRAEEVLERLHLRLTEEQPAESGPAGSAHMRSLAGLIERYLDRGLNAPLSPARTLPEPPGSPIGIDPGGMDDWCGWDG